MTRTGPPRRYDYLSDGQQIYKESFATIRAEADLTGFGEDAQTVVVRMIHAAGDIGLPALLQFHERLVTDARAALRRGAPIFTDSQMLASGITRSRLPADNQVVCRLHDPEVASLARDWETTRSAAAVSLWGSELAGAVVAIGNAPTALFHLLEVIAAGGPRPAAVLGLPVGFVGSAESKQALVDNPWDVPFLVARGRRGGSAMAASAVNALAQESEL